MALRAGEPRLDAGVDRLFDLEFAAARAVFDDHIRSRPEEEAGLLLHAAAIWWEAATEPLHGAVAPGLEDRFRRDLKAALKLSKKRFRHDDPGVRADARLAAGLAWTLRGQWEMDRGRRRTALSSWRKGAKHLRRCLDLDPRRSDAYLGIGLLRYHAGDREEGLRALDVASRRGSWVGPAADILLVKLMILDRGDYEGALHPLEALRRRFPRSLYLRLLETVALQRLGRWAESYRLAARTFERPEYRRGLLGAKQPRILCGFYQHRCLERGTLVGVVEWVSRALDSGRPAGAWAALLRLYRGLAYGMTGKRDLAVADLEKVGSPRGLEGMRDIVDACLTDPCGRSSVVRFMERIAFPARP